MIIIFTLNAIPKPKHNKIDKPKKIHHNKGGLSQKQLGQIRNKYRKKVNARSEDHCEGCGKHKLSCWTLENAHIDGRGSIKHMTTETDLLRLCGPSTAPGTCHEYVTMTREGRDYMDDQRERLLQGLKPLKIDEWKRRNKDG